MNTGLAIELAEQMMLDMGYGENYTIRFRHLQISPSAKLEMKGFNKVFMLIEPDYATKVYSKSGIFNLQDKGIKEMQYIHKGLTTIINQSKDTYLQVKLIQISGGAKPLFSE